MPTLETDQIAQYYELHGDSSNPPLLLVGGLGGVGDEWGPQIELFARDYHVILPDQRGTGRTSRAPGGYATEMLAADMAALIRHLDVGPVHYVGESTGAAIGQYLALDHPGLVATLSMVGAFATFDAYAKRGSDVRRRLVLGGDRVARYEGYATYLFSPPFTRQQPAAVQRWIDRMVSLPEPPDDHRITIERLDMIARHDSRARLGEIRAQTLVVAGRLDVAAPLGHSLELASAIRGSELRIVEDTGHLVALEKPEEFHEVVDGFIRRAEVPMGSRQ